MKNLQKEKGITLLTLIITVILLLIVSGVTLNIALGENGLLKKSKEAVNKSKLAQTEELIKMDLLSAYIDAELTGLDKPSSETIKEIVEKHGGTIDESDPNIIKTPDGEIKLDSILNESSSSTQNPGEINKTVEELNNQINELNSQLETERQEKQELESQIEDLQSQVASWKKKAEDGEVTIEEKNTQISGLNDQITAKNQELDNKNNEIQTLNESLTTVTAQKNTLETQVANLESQITDKDTEIANKEEIIASKETTITSLNTQIEELNTSITDLNSQLDTAKADKEELEEQVTSLNTQVATWKKKAEDGEATITEKDTQISNLNDQITAKNSEITTKNQEISDLNGQVTTLTNEKNSLETQVTNLNTQVANLQKKQATGTAVASDVLSGKTFSNGSGVGLTGTMVNKGTLNEILQEGDTLTLQPGYYSGGTVTLEKPKSISTVKTEIERDGLRSHLGDLVDYEPMGGGKWRVFYYNTEAEWGDPAGTLYLKRDYDGLKMALQTPTATTNGTNYMKKMNPLWAASANSSSIDLDNEKAVAWLCDPDNWTEYKTSAATYAIGSPSVEMYVKSYNIWKNSSNALTCGILDANGYGFAAKGGSLSEYTPDNSIEAGPGTMYITKSRAWCLASPACYYNFHTCSANGYFSQLRTGSFGIKPNVCPVVSINP